MSKGFILIDGNNLGFAAQSGAPLKLGTIEVTAIYNFVRSIRMLVSAYPMLKPIVLWDGLSWRKMAFKGYKANRDKINNKSDEKKVQQRDAYRKQRPYIQKALKMLGIAQMSCDNLEADDLAAILVRRYVAKGKRILLISGDKDWIQLVQPKVSWLDPMSDVKITAETLSKRLGYDTEKKRFVAYSSDQERADFIPIASPRAWLEAKALMGDTSDEIPGVGGIGPKGAIELLSKYGSVAAFHNGYIDGSINDAPKKLADFAESDEKQFNYRRNINLMDLNDPNIPPPVNLSVETGAVNKGLFRQFCERLSFKSLLTSFDSFMEPFEQNE